MRSHHQGGLGGARVEVTRLSFALTMPRNAGRRSGLLAVYVPVAGAPTSPGRSVDRRGVGQRAVRHSRFVHRRGRRNATAGRGLFSRLARPADEATAVPGDAAAFRAPRSKGIALWRSAALDVPREESTNGIRVRGSWAGLPIIDVCVACRSRVVAFANLPLTHRSSKQSESVSHWTPSSKSRASEQPTSVSHDQTIRTTRYIQCPRRSPTRGAGLR